MTGAGRLTPSVAGRRTACGRHGAAFEAENGGVWAQGLLQPRAAARGRVPCVFVRLSAVDGVARSAGRRASCEPLGLAGCFGGQVQRPKCIPWRQVSKPQGARTTSRCGSRRLGIVSIYPYRAHTAEEPVGYGPRGRCYGPVNPNPLSRVRVGSGKGVKYFMCESSQK